MTSSDGWMRGDGRCARGQRRLNPGYRPFTWHRRIGDRIWGRRRSEQRPPARIFRYFHCRQSAPNGLRARFGHRKAVIVGSAPDDAPGDTYFVAI